MEYKEAIRRATEKVRKFLPVFETAFPAEQSKDNVYATMQNVSWTTGFYSGILWLCYELTEDRDFLDSALSHYESYKKRIYEEEGIDHHDLGFLYSLSCVAQYKVLGDEDAKATAIRAAECLLRRYHPKGEFIQAWGALDDPDSYRLIIDCLLNLPLLFWASEVTGDQKFYQAAARHMRTASRTVIRPDSSTYHTYFFDIHTGEPTRGETHQGYSDESCWARGQAWAIYGLALCYHYTRDNALLDDYNRVTDYFLAHLPQNQIPYWDLIFDDTSGQPRDTSAAAIAVCGILEMGRTCPNARHTAAAGRMLQTLSAEYNTADLPDCAGLITDGFYNHHFCKQAECTIWGDYYYLEALMRAAKPDWKMYW